VARWTVDQVVAAAPDAGVVRAARGLARPGPWSELGSTEALVWGRCQGSGATPYQVAVDVAEPAFRCTCPSRKQPCKHAIALLLLWVEGSGSVADRGEAPAGVAGARPRRTDRGTGADGPADPAAQARRREQRLALMDAGIDDFETWLYDLVRQGLASARHQPYAFWDGAAARLVDARLPGLAEAVRDMGGELHRRRDWADHLTAAAGRWFLAVRAWRRRDDLDASTRGDLRVVLGWPVATEEVLRGERVRDRWLVMGVHRTDDGRLQAQRTWLRGTGSGRWALILDFAAAAGGTLRVAQVTGSVVDAELALYPGSEPRRAVFATDPGVVAHAGRLDGRTTVAAALDRVADAVAANPWAVRVPVVLGSVAVTFAEAANGPVGGRAAAVEVGGAALPLVEDQDPWPALAITGGRPVAVFGEWERGALRLLTATAEDALAPL
jgi:hypothetical protein